MQESTSKLRWPPHIALLQSLAALRCPVAMQGGWHELLGPGWQWRLANNKQFSTAVQISTFSTARTQVLVFFVQLGQQLDTRL